MKIINFTGTYLKPTKINKKDRNNKFIPHEASLVQINPSNKNDILTLKSTSEAWDENSNILSFSDIIYEDAKNIYEEEIDTGMHKFYAITNQKRDFKKLIPEEILGLTEITSFPNSKQINIDVFEVDPENNHWSEERTYKNIGTALLNAIKEIFEGKEITVHSVHSALDFYEKNGFKQTYKNSHDLHFIKL